MFCNTTESKLNSVRRERDIWNKKKEVMMMIIFTVKFIINDSISQRRYRTIMTKKHDLLHTCENKKFQINFWDQYQYLGNCPPTPPLTQQQSIDDN